MASTAVDASRCVNPVDAIEHSAEDRFDVKFIGAIGIPPNMDDLSAAMEVLNGNMDALYRSAIYR